MLRLIFQNAKSLNRRNLLITGLAMSIGWGIRGNFGHQNAGAFAGCLCAIAVCLVSGREDWRRKLLYFAFFGALGWGFGATISYMQVLSYTESGQAYSQLFGYICLFVIGFLWAGMGTVGTTMAAVFTETTLAHLIKPVLFVLGSFLLLDLIEDLIANLLNPTVNFDSTKLRHLNPFYWFDANYLPAFFALFGVGIYDLWERREKNILLLPVYGLIGAGLGYIIQYLLHAYHLDGALATAFTYSLGDPTYINPASGKPAYDSTDLLNNWPVFFSYYPKHIGWLIGLVAGISLYFLRKGKFNSGSSLIVYIASGWLLSFLAFPVLGSLLFIKWGGLRMTPPRSDDWAGILGVFVGSIIWLRKNNYLSIAWASVIGGTIGGLGFAGVQWIRQLLTSFGNPRVLLAHGLAEGMPEYNQKISSWANWQNQNWHSFLEQGYGFVNGIAIAVAIGLLSKKIPVNDNRQMDEIEYSSKKYRWTLEFAALFTLLILPYVNIISNVDTWSEQLNQSVWMNPKQTGAGNMESSLANWDMPYLGRLPGINFLHLTAYGWYNTIWILLLIIACLLLKKYRRDRIPLIPSSWMGKGQFIFGILLWVMVIANFEKALPHWAPSRLLTEWVITVNAIVLTYLVLSTVPKDSMEMNGSVLSNFKPEFKRAWKIGLTALVSSSLIFFLTNRLLYRYPDTENATGNHYQKRFGKEANWRSTPILKNKEHK